MTRIGSVTVYCSSSRSVHPGYLDGARELGRRLAQSERTVVYGGGTQGLMGVLSVSAREVGGRVVGIGTETLRETELVDESNDENVIVRTMRERKKLLLERGDAIVTLPGGIGTLEEVFEALVGRIVGEHDMPIVVMNQRDPVDGTGYYDPLMAMFEHMFESRFARRDVLDLIDVVSSPEDVIAALDRHEREPASTGDRTRFMPGAIGSVDG